MNTKPKIPLENNSFRASLTRQMREKNRNRETPTLSCRLEVPVWIVRNTVCTRRRRKSSKNMIFAKF